MGLKSFLRDRILFPLIDLLPFSLKNKLKMVGTCCFGEGWGYLLVARLSWEWMAVMRSKWSLLTAFYSSTHTEKSGLAVHTSLRIRSIISFVSPYGLVVDRGKSSLIGTDFGVPYTVADELKTILFTPCLSIQSRRLKVPVRLL